MAEDPQSSFKYKAFISYSHRDKHWADLIHKALETYRVPKSLVGKSTPRGIVPKTLFPIFRDREELPTSADLGGVIKDALEKSAYLIVICSPRSAQSRWVNEEILNFKRIGKKDRILAIIIDGEPNGSDKGMDEVECFPSGLRFHLGADGLEDRDNPAEPVAADAREVGDGKKNALLKLKSGLLGVNFNDLKQREKLRQKQRRLQLAVFVGVLLLAGAAGLIQIRQKDKAGQLQEAEARVGQMRQAIQEGRPRDAIEFGIQAYRIFKKWNHSAEKIRGLMQVAVDANRLIARVKASDEKIDTVRLSPDGKWLLTIPLGDHPLRVWNTETWKEQLEVPISYPEWAVFSRERDELIVLKTEVDEEENAKATISYWGLEQSALVDEVILEDQHGYMAPMDSGEYDGLFILDNYYAVEYGAPVMATLFSTETGEAQVEFEMESDFRYSEPFFYQDLDRFVLLGNDFGLVYRLSDGAALGPLEGFQGGRISVLRAPGTHFLLVSSKKNDIQRWQAWDLKDGSLLLDETFESWRDVYFFESPTGELLYTSEVPEAGLAELGIAAINIGRSGSHYLRVVDRPDGLRVFASRGTYSGGTAVLNFPATEEEIRIELQTGGFRAILLEPEGRFLAAGDNLGYLTIWDTTPLIERTGGMEEQPVFRMETDPAAARFVGVLGPGRLGMWDEPSESLLFEIEADGEKAETRWEFRPGPDRVVVSSADAFSFIGFNPTDHAIFDGTTGKQLLTVRNVSQSLKFSPDGKSVLAYLEGGIPQLYRTEDPEAVLKIDHPDWAELEYSRPMGFSADSRHLIAASGMGMIYYFNTSTGELEKSFRFLDVERETSFISSYFSPSGKWALILGSLNPPYLVDLENQTTREVLERGADTLTPPAFIPDESQLIMEAGFGSLHFYTFPDFDLKYAVVSDARPDRTQFFPEINQYLLMPEYGYEPAMLIEGETGQTLRTFPNFLAYHPEPPLLAHSAEGGIVQIWDLQTMEVLKRIPLDFVQDSFFSADGSLFYFTARNDRLLRVRLSEPLEALMEANPEVRAIAEMLD